MPSTYSPSLRLELIGSGEQSGTWGTTTNTNLGTLLEQSIVGVQAITMFDVDYTLSNFNGVSDEARKAVLVVSGTNTVARDIIAPLVAKTYTIKNNTTGGFAINIKAATGSSVSIPNGVTSIVYCDGTNFNLAVNQTAVTAGTGISVATVGVTNTISIDSTVATLTGTQTLTNKTLTAPNLGTPTTLVGTNITGTAAGFSIGGNAATVTTNANLTGDVTSVGNAATVVTNANLTGMVTSVGNATSLGSFTSANLATALTDETGSGAAVFALSPTLTTPTLTTPTLTAPNLGTPTTLVGTNITGTATAFTASNVTTNANLTGGVTSVGNAATVVTNANLTGAVTSVGNATSLGSFTSANLAAALTDETGSGAAVFATSPTLVTPTFVATNVTGLPLTTGVTGTLPLANGGTNSTFVPLAGTVIYGTGTAYGRTLVGTSGEVLKSAGGSAPSFEGVTNSVGGIDMSGTQGYTFTALSGNFYTMIMLTVVGLSTTSTGVPTIRLGDGTSIVTTGYTSTILHTTSTALSNSLSATSGWEIVATGAASYVWNGMIEIFYASDNWVFRSTLSSGTTTEITNGYININPRYYTASMNVRVTTTGGTDTFDSGIIILSYL